MVEGNPQFVFVDCDLGLEREDAMKFTDGYWQIRPGVTPYYAVHVHKVEVDENELTVYAPTKRLNHLHRARDGAWHVSKRRGCGSTQPTPGRS